VTREDEVATSPRSRLSWSLMDQAVSSLSNYLFLVLLIQTSTLVDVGIYGLAYTTYFLYQSVGRGAVTDPLLVRHSPDAADWRTRCGLALGASLALGSTLGLVSVAAALGMGGRWGSALLALGVVTPGLMAQDTVRMLMFADRRPRTACANDLLFLAVQGLAYVVLFVRGSATPTSLMLGWGLAAAVSAGVGMVTLRCLPRLRGLRAWWSESRDLAGPYVADYLANRGAEQLTLVAVAATAGPAAAGVVTAARTLFAPLTTVQAGVNSFALPEASRRYREGDSDGMRRLVWVFAAAMAVMMAVFGVCLAALPESWGRGLFAGNWGPAREVVWPMTMFSVLNAFGFALWVGGKAAQRGGGVLTARLVSGLVMLLGAGVGASWSGPVGAVTGMSLGAVAMCVLLARVLSRSLVPDRQRGARTRDHTPPRDL